MAASGFTPISLYYSTTASAVPTSGNLANGELGLNIADMKLYAKNSAGTVTLLASNAGASGSVTSVALSGGTTGLTVSGSPITTSGTITLAGTLAIANGGTGQTTANAAFNALVPSQTSQAGKYLTTDGTNTSWGTNPLGTVTSVGQSFTGGLISVAGSPVTTSGTLALTVAGTSGGIPYFSSASTWATSAALAASSLVVGGGAGAAPSTVTTGTGVVTALGVAVGSAGAFVVNGGALGTPSSGTVTNLTGTASININGTVGATTATTGAFTTLSATGVATFSAGTAALPAITTTGDTNTGLWFPAADTIAFTEGGVESMRIDSAGNLGLGTVPSSWGNNWRAFTFGVPGELASTVSGSSSVQLVNAAFNNNTNWLYTYTSIPAARYQQTAGTHAWFNAPLGTAGGIVTFTQAMTLDADGDLGIATTSPAYKLDVNGVARVGGLRQSFETGLYNVDGTLSNYSATNGVYLNGNAAGWLRLNGDGTAASYIQITGSSYSPANVIQFITASSERMRLDASGNLGIGTTSPVDSLTVYKSTSAGTSTVTFINTATANTANTMRIRLAPSPGFVGTNLQPYIESYCEDAGSQAAGLAFGTYPTGAATERLRITSAGNILVGGTAARGTTVGTAHLDLFNGTAPAGALTNGVSLYSSSGDLKFMDSAGNAYTVGFRNVPQSGSSKTASYTLATTDVGEYILLGASGAIVIPDATFAAGDVITIFNNTASTATLTCSITTAYIAGTFTDKATMTLAAAGVATVLFITSTLCVVSGNVT